MQSQVTQDIWSSSDASTSSLGRLLGRRRRSDSVSPPDNIPEHPPCKRHAGPHDFPSSANNEHTSTLINGILTGQQPRDERVASMEHFFGVDPFISEDPTNKTRYRERKLRSQLDIEQRKNDIRHLKEFGGACLWCHRSKKKCGAVYPCPSCVHHNRKCIRNSGELSLASLLVEPTKDSSWAAFGLPLQAALDRFQEMGDRAFHRREFFNAVIHFGQRNASLLDKWNIELAHDDLDLSQLSKVQISTALFQLAKKTKPHFHCSGLAQLENKYAYHPLVNAALKMARLVMTIGGLAKSQVHARVSDLDQGQVVVFLIFHVCFLDLTYMSNQFANDLCSVLRKKQSQDMCRFNIHRTSSHKDLNPVWVAIAIYFRVVSGCLDLQRTQVIAGLFGQLEEPLMNLRSTLLNTVKVVNIHKNASLKSMARHILKTQIPELPTNHHIFDLALSLVPTDSEDTIASANLIPDPFAEDQYDLNTFLHGFTELHVRPEVAQSVRTLVHSAPPEVSALKPTSIPFLAPKIPPTPAP
ncbi:hypothetical protein N7495_004433 [Penicillium taxi]|uniref:uncharacterized protein n=1 Tax=Penicillium taxi TaxID=168475 RepID=UPI0025458E2A|nr:uncharacterized protein N7495_004433 [Penicillium taxi]KAJ5899689.1 hypothetical protein N7495_004433 [Penicillium taxi]